MKQLEQNGGLRNLLVYAEMPFAATTGVNTRLGHTFDRLTTTHGVNVLAVAPDSGLHSTEFHGAKTVPVRTISGSYTIVLE